MKVWQHDGASLEQIKVRHGEWTAMSIRLPDGGFTREPAIDHRLKRLVQTAADLMNKPLAQCRVLDLACLEGHYGIEFALQGCEVVCVEIRKANLAKAAYAAHALGLTNCRIVQDDVRNLNVAEYGRFDIIICSGILYHLTASDAAGLIGRMHDCCDRLCLVDTYIATREATFAEVDGLRLGGVVYREHEDGANETQKESDLWASIDNNSSFWFTLNALTGLFARAGFTSLTDVLMPTHQELTYDRRCFAAIKGAPVRVLSSPMTDATGYVDAGLPDPHNLHPHQIDHGAMFRFGKRVLPQNLKDVIKPTLRKLGVLKTEDYVFPVKPGDKH